MCQAITHPVCDTVCDKTKVDPHCSLPNGKIAAMSLSLAIVGLPNAGKSTLFNALLARQIANVAPYPFCTIDPNTGVVEVPDARLEVLAKVIAENPSTSPCTVRCGASLRMAVTPPIVPAVVEFKDIAGLVAGASKGEGLGNKFLAHIRECVAIVHVLRAFGDERVVRATAVSPKDDLETIKTELCLADLQTLENQKAPNFSTATKEEKERWETVLKLRETLGAGIEVRNRRWEAGARSGMWDENERKVINSLFLLTAKPTIFVLNVDEEELRMIPEQLAEKYNLAGVRPLISVCAKVEMELAELSGEERKEYLAQSGAKESGLEKLIRQGYETLGLQTFLTAREKEVRAWTVRQGAKAPEAAGVIYTDFEKGFIKAQVCDYEDFVKDGGWKGAAEAGHVRLEGKDYAVKEGDVVEFKFNL